MKASPLSKRPQIDPRYWIVAGACLTQFTVIGLLFCYGLFFKVFEAEFGWSRTVLSANASIAFFMMGVLGIAVGRLSDLLGPRIVLACSGLFYSLGYMSISLVSEPWHLLAIFGLFISLGMSTHDVVTLSTVARWFDKKRGMMTGVAKVGTGLGQMTLPPLAALLLTWLGWQKTAVILGLFALAALLAAAALMRRAPPLEGRAGGVENGLEFKAVARTRVFWSLCLIQFLYLPTLTTLPLHIVVHGMDLGMSAALAATLLSVTAGASIAGRLTVGGLTDRIGGRNALVLCFSPLILALLALLITTSHVMLFAVMAVYGFAHGGLFTVMAPTIASYFGTRAHGTIFGAILFFGATGGALGPIVTGKVFDETGSYDTAFMGLAAMAALGLALVVSLPLASAMRSAAKPDR